MAPRSKRSSNPRSTSIRCRTRSSKPAHFNADSARPVFVLMTRQLLAANPDPSEDDIRHYLAGNLCRCGAYPQIIAAVKIAARNFRPASSN